ncbi:polyadenylate-binding protein RBP47B'-like isoform X2 [Actinidia eriantha]|uniref:polyadenylate-binding protein RBP47B'-like isoform X2 n=1 Tax=Actinidia eriantha TaxID=165200 RepID=UPI002584A6DA|nr:polyadenylate-binding protein RBP47B'-like isoform X2 [Actinidia eriantha]
MEAQAQQHQHWVMSAQAQTHHQHPTVGLPTASQPPYHQPTTLEEVRTLWIGDLQYWIDDAYLQSCFAHTGEVVSIEIIRNKITGQPEGYGFVEFVSHAAAERILQTYNGTQMPGTEQTFRLNWASFGIGEKRPDAGPEHSIFVGDLTPDVTDYLLQETFRTQYPSVRGAKVVTDPNTGRSKGYGFVKFADEMERNRAMAEMNGVYCSTRPMRISAATPKKTTGFQQPYAAARGLYLPPAYTPPVQTIAVDNDVNNTTVFIGNLDSNITEEELKQIFVHFGEIVYVKIPTTKGCGFVQFATRTSAEDAIQRMQGVVIGQQVVHLSWGRNPTAKQYLVLCLRTCLVCGVSKQIQVNIAPIILMDKVMKPMLMGLMILHYMRMGHTLVTCNTLNRLKVLKKWHPWQVLSHILNKGRNTILWRHQTLTS